MSSDRHFAHGEPVPAWGANFCAYCKRPIRGRRFTYGSNACRQAAYRQRIAKLAKVSAEFVERGPETASKEAHLRRQNIPAKGGRS